MQLSDLIQVTMVYSPADGSPPELASYSGVIVAVPPNYIPLPSRGELIGVKGYSRQSGGQWQWVLQADGNPLDVFVDSLTGQGNWDIPASRADIKLFCQQLLGAGIPRSVITARIPVVYNSIATEIRAEDA